MAPSASPPPPGQAAAGTDPVEIRPAATVMLVRDEPVAAGGTELQVLMVRRNLRSDFVGGAYVFPGGAVDPLDGGPEAEALCAGRTDAGASALLGLESGGLAYWVAVVRETFEEAGLLLARRDDGPGLLAGDPVEEARFAAARVAVNDGTRRFLDLCRNESLRLSVGDIHYFAHWITPRGAPRRYDTRFFVAAAPPGQIAAHDAGETIAEVWISPDDALARHRSGEIEIIFPTIRNLQVIGRFATSAALLAAAEEASSAVPAIEPRVVPDGNGMRIVLPGDPGYERGAVPDPGDGGARGDFNEAVREVSMRANEEGPDAAPRTAPLGVMIPAVPDFGIGPAPEPGRLDEVAPGVRRLTAPNPGLMTGPGTNTYLVGNVDPVVIDPGPADSAHTAAIVAAAAPLGTVRSILVTHTHVDHAPGAAALAAATGARLVGFGPSEEFSPDERVGEGWTLPRPGSTPSDDLTLRALHTPGHASDHLCWLVEEHGLLLSGDHVMHGSTVVIRPPDGDLHQYLASLIRLRDDPAVRTLAPGHGRLMDHVPEVIDALVAHRLGRHEVIADALARTGGGTVDELLPLVYGDVTEKQLPVARFSLWAHLRALGQEGRAAPVDLAAGAQDTIETRWSAT